MLEHTPKATENYEARVAMFAQQALAGGKMLEGALSVHIVAKMQIPVSRAKKLKDGDPHTQRPDADNISKSCLDATQSILFANDCQVAKLVVEKQWATVPCAEVVVEEMCSISTPAD